MHYWYAYGFDFAVDLQFGVWEDSEKMDMDLVDIKKVKKAFTHGGVFHADDILSAALLRLLNPDIVIERGNVIPPDYDGIVFDIGNGRYDHHQKNKAIRENGIPYAAFGLLWKDYGNLILQEEDALQFDEDFIQPLDLTDNTGKANILSGCFAEWNPRWDEEDADWNEAFMDAVDMAERILKKKFQSILSNRKAYELVKSLAKEQKGNILIMDRVIPWKMALKKTDFYYVIFPSIRGGYNVQAVPFDEDEHLPKKPFPMEWRGLAAEDLQTRTGVQTAQFCHMAGFLCVTDTLEDGIKLAECSLMNG